MSGRTLASLKMPATVGELQAFAAFAGVLDEAHEGTLQVAVGTYPSEIQIGDPNSPGEDE